MPRNHPSRQLKMLRKYNETHEPHPGHTPESTCETYPRDDDYLDVPGGKPTDPEDLEMNGHSGFRHVRCPGGVVRCKCGRLAYHLDSLIIAVDGACPGNGRIDARRSACGIWFGDGMGLNSLSNDYRQNFAFQVPDHPWLPHTSQRAELYAAAGALLKARTYVEHGGQYPCGDDCKTPCTVKHIVLKTDSAYLVNGITSHINKWRHNGWKTSSGTNVKNRDLWEWLEVLVHEYLGLEVAVDFWLVRREHNKEADRLANVGLASNMILTMEGGFHNRF